MELPVIYPMNAKTDEKRLKMAWESEEWVAEEKYDGSRYLMYITPEGCRFFSRRKSDVTGYPVEKTDCLPHLNKVAVFDNEIIVLDGEIVAGEGLTSNEVVSIMGSLPDRAINLQEQRGYVNYVAFDILYADGGDIMDLPWTYRREILERFFENFISNEYMVVSNYTVDNKKEFYEDILKRNGEGVILKNTKGLYTPDKRPVNTWIKVKTEDTYDVIIIGFDPPKREYEGKYPKEWSYWEGDTPVTKYHALGWVGAVRFGQYDKNGNLVEIGSTSGMDEATRKYMSENKDQLIGQVIEVAAMQRIKKTGALRHPRFIGFRNDKNKKECKI